MDETPLELKRQFAIVGRRLPLILTCTALVVLTAFFVARGQAPAFEASTTLLVGPSIGDPIMNDGALQVPQYMSQVYVRAATSSETLASVIDQLGLTITPGQLANQITVTSAQDPATITITTHAGESKLAVDLANAIAGKLDGAANAAQAGDQHLLSLIDPFLTGLRQDIATTLAGIESLRSSGTLTVADVARLSELRDSLSSQLSTYAAVAGLVPNGSSNGITVLSAAAEPAGQVAPRTLYYTGLALVLGFMLAVALAAVLEYADDRMRNRADVEAVTGLATLGVIGRDGGRLSRGSALRRLAVINEPASRTAEAYRSVRTKVDLSMPDSAPRALLVTSTTVSDGKSATSINLAAAFAQAGRRVLLIDADLRRPQIHVLFQLSISPGLTTLLANDQIDPRDLAMQTEVAGLHVLTAGQLPLDPAALLSSQRMRELITVLKSRWDLLLFDAPPAGVADDPLLLAMITDGTVLVVDLDRGDRRSLRAAEAAFGGEETHLLGTVLYDAKRSSARAYDYQKQERDRPEGPTTHAIKRTDTA